MVRFSKYGQITHPSPGRLNERRGYSASKPISRIALLTIRSRKEDKAKFTADHLRKGLEKLTGGEASAPTGEKGKGGGPSRYKEFAVDYEFDYFNNDDDGESEGNSIFSKVTYTF